jgi:ferrous iron transport protein B
VTGAAAVARPGARADVRIALAGQPNVGKSTVFNVLTGSSQRVGNWPGKTVEHTVGACTCAGRSVQVVDLPGTHSLTASSEEERAAREFILDERPDAVVVIVNAATLERSLYLVAELVGLPRPLVIGLNMMDLAGRRGIEVDPRALEAELGVRVVPMVATRGQGVRELMDAACRLAAAPSAFAPSRPVVRPELQRARGEIRRLVAGRVSPEDAEDWVALKLLEGDAEVADRVSRELGHEWPEVERLLRDHPDAYLEVATARYAWIQQTLRAAVRRPGVPPAALGDRVDRVATHPFWGLLLLMGVLAVVFWLTYALAWPIVDWLDTAVGGSVARWARGALSGAPARVCGLLVDGVMGGAGSVLLFLPILVVLFAVLGALEDVGYLARAAYVTDRFMSWMGLRGRSFLPLFLGFGCNVPAILCARIVEGRRQRLLTILLAPLVPCTARLSVVAFLAPAFFGESRLLVSCGLVVVNLAVLALAGVAMSRLAFRGGDAPFVMEMPLYHLPSPRTIGLFVWRNSWEFVRKAGTIIVVVSAVVWALANLPAGDPETSLLAALGRGLEPAGRWMGLDDWRLLVALLTSFVAKENTIATLGILYGTPEEGVGLAARVAGSMSAASGLAFLAVQMLFVPCLATVAVTRQETGRWGWALLDVSLLLAISLAAGVAVFQLGRLLGL